VAIVSKPVFVQKSWDEFLHVYCVLFKISTEEQNGNQIFPIISFLLFMPSLTTLPTVQLQERMLGLDNELQKM
jgi:hypothetical protein